MAKSGPVILVEDDVDDQDFFEEALRWIGLENELKVFPNAEEAFKYLKTTTEQPFIIFSDVNLPGLNGVEFKRKIDNDKELREKSIPFAFLSTSDDQQTVNIAYTQLTVQGYFKKPQSYDELKALIKLIIDYWQKCRHPNTF